MNRFAGRTSFRFSPLSKTITRRCARPRISAALSPAGPPPVFSGTQWWLDRGKSARRQEGSLHSQAQPAAVGGSSAEAAAAAAAAGATALGGVLLGLHPPPDGLATGPNADWQPAAHPR